MYMEGLGAHMDWSKADRRPAASLYFFFGGVHDSHVFPWSGKGCFNGCFFAVSLNL